MPKMPPKDRDVIEKIGAETLEARGYTASAIKQWKYRGIPWPKRAEIAELAAATGIVLPLDFMKKQRAPKRRARAQQAERAV